MAQRWHNAVSQLRQPAPIIGFDCWPNIGLLALANAAEQPTLAQHCLAILALCWPKAVSKLRRPAISIGFDCWLNFGPLAVANAANAAKQPMLAHHALVILAQH